MNIHISKIFVLCMIIGVFGIGTAMAAPSVTIDPASTTELSPGDTFSININVDPDGNGVSSGQIDLSFDTSVLEVTNRVKGDMLGTDAFDIGSDYNNTAGTVTAVLARMGTTTPPTAAGTWATVTFQVKAGVADVATTIAITSVGMVDGDFAAITGIITTGGTATVGVVDPTLDTFTVTPATVEQGGTVEIDIAFSTEVSWAINVNSSTATVKTWSGTSTNPTAKDWVTSTSTATGAYTVDVFMNGVLADSKTVTVTDGITPTLASITSWTLPATGACGTAIDATVTIENTGTETLWFVVSVAGASTTGESIVGLGTAELDAGATKAVPVKIPVPGDADAAGTYTLYPDVYTLDGYPDVGTLQATGSGDTIVIS